MVNIKDFVKEEEAKTTWVKYLDDFEIEIRYLPRKEFQRIYQKSLQYTWDKKDHVKIEKPNEEVFNRQFVQKVIVGWKGLKASTLAKIIPLKYDDPNLDFPFTLDNACFMLDNAYDFSAFIFNAVRDLTSFESEETEAEKKI